jgi:hypothetical protein
MEINGLDRNFPEEGGASAVLRHAADQSCGGALAANNVERQQILYWEGLLIRRCCAQSRTAITTRHSPRASCPIIYIQQA